MITARAARRAWKILLMPIVARRLLFGTILRSLAAGAGDCPDFGPATMQREKLEAVKDQFLSQWWSRMKRGSILFAIAAGRA